MLKWMCDVTMMDRISMYKRKFRPNKYSQENKRE